MSNIKVLISNHTVKLSVFALGRLELKAQQQIIY